MVISGFSEVLQIGRSAIFSVHYYSSRPSQVLVAVYRSTYMHTHTNTHTKCRSFKSYPFLSILQESFKTTSGINAGNTMSPCTGFTSLDNVFQRSNKLSLAVPNELDHPENSHKQCSEMGSVTKQKVYFSVKSFYPQKSHIRLA